ncbi:D-hexose-6-phosphate mutarotase [Bifidobacterium leontopitheci]|uniref:Putative glucose-6-phosphate 1-epimerase n=1 Tax=Bifidobacterium leontopitheci TaxID=2650774 RepID=A0A6I1GE29_9BIFI|nr:D-hexose-6-phosphate mutarotase [Bifidobacterium leontopitheci]KAB7789884.1 D-hexose-6-phosphate mutarotase [Bifidobacterium leontopitheci]
MSELHIIRNISNDDGAAQVSDYGAHLLTWTPTAGRQVIWQPKAVYLGEGKAIRGGVPVVFPWFAKGWENGEMTAKTPKHGFARTSDWHVDAEYTDDSRIRYTLTDADANPEWLAELHCGAAPRFHATYDIEVGSELAMTLTVTNDGDEPLRYEAALHTYFSTSDITAASIHGLEHADYLDATLPGFPPRVQGDEPITFDGATVDRIYYATDPIMLEDPAWNRAIVITAEGTKQTVTWNPGVAADTEIGDMQPGEWRDFVAIEAASCREHAIVLQPGESHAITQRVQVVGR